MPARAVSDRPRPSSQNSGVGPDRNIDRSQSAKDLENIRQNLQKRNSPRGERLKIPDGKQGRTVPGRSASADLSGVSSRPVSKSSHTRSFSGDLDPRASRSAHARSFGGEGTGLYGSATPRRGTRQGAKEEAGPTRRAPDRSQSYDPKSRPAGEIRRGVPAASRSGDLFAMRQSRANDLSGMRQGSADSRSSHARGTPSPSPDQMRRGRKRDGPPPPGTPQNGVPASRAPPRAKSFEGQPPQPPQTNRGAPRRTKSGDF